MSFFKNSQVARLFKVSNTTVTNWIEAAEKNQIDLELTTVGSRKVIIDSAKNRELIERLVAKGKKHIGKTKRVVVTPQKEISKILTRSQIAELVANLSSRYEIPYKFSYLNEGADLWDKHYQLTLNALTKPVSKEHKLILENLEGIAFKFKTFETINIIDIGCGNGLPAIPIIEKLIEMGFGVNYTAIDISERMIEIDKRELLKRFPDLNYNYFVVDLDQANISEILMGSRKADNSINFLLYLGGTLGNQNDSARVFANLRDSMCSDDFLLVGNSIAEEYPKTTAYKPNDYHYRRTTWMLDVLGLKGLYPDSVLNKYDPIKRETTRKIPIQKDVTINFEYEGQNIPIVFNQYDEILVLRYREFKEPELIQQVIERGFMIEQFVTNRNSTYALMLVRPKQL